MRDPQVTGQVTEQVNVRKSAKTFRVIISFFRLGKFSLVHFEWKRRGKIKNEKIITRYGRTKMKMTKT